MARAIRGKGKAGKGAFLVGAATPKTAKVAAPDRGEPEEVDMQALAKAVAWHETKLCTLGVGEKHNNCFGIKNGNTAPCPRIARNNMCIYEDPKDSYVAFEKIWLAWYAGEPTIEKARRWSGNDNAESWLKNVTAKYEEYK